MRNQRRNEMSKILKEKVSSNKRTINTIENKIIECLSELEVTSIRNPKPRQLMIKGMEFSYDVKTGKVAADLFTIQSYRICRYLEEIESSLKDLKKTTEQKDDMLNILDRLQS